MIVFPNAYNKFNKIIKDGANLIIYADRNKEPGRNEYFVREVYLNEELSRVFSIFENLD